MVVLFVIDGGLLDGETALVGVDVFLEAGDVFGGGGDGDARVACEDDFFEVFGKGEFVRIVYCVAGEEGDTPGTTFASGLHDRDGAVEGSGEHALTDTGRLEVTTVARDAIHTDHLFLEEDVVTDLQHTDGTVEVGTHEVGEVELVVGRTHEHGATFCQSGDRLTTDIVVGHQTTAVGVTLQSLVEELAVEFVHIYLDTKQLLIFLKETHPGVDVAGAVVAVDHGDE